MRTVLVRLGGILLLVALAIWLYCLLDAITADRDQVRRLPKGAWIAILLLTSGIGAIAWLVWGRPRGPATSRGTGARPRLGTSGRTAWPARPTRPGGPAGGTFGRRGPLPPDDDPEFLARLDRQAAKEQEKLLGSWEEDLRRREEELRRDRRPDQPDDGEPAGPA